MLTIFLRTIKHKDPRPLVVDGVRPGVWVHAENPTEQEIARIVALLGVDESFLRDAQDPHEVPRIETEDDVTYVFTRVPQYNDENDADTTPMLIALGTTFVLTVTPHHFPFIERFRDGTIPIFTTQRAKLFLQIFFAITTVYDRDLATLGKRVRTLGATTVENIENRHIALFVALEKTLNDFLSALVPTGTLLRRLLSGTVMRAQLHEQDTDLVEDLLITNQQLEEMTRSLLKNAVNIRNGYETMLTNNLNRTMRLLTALTIILMVPTIIGGFFGMNVHVPLAMTPWGFWIILGITTATMSVVAWFFHRRRWL